jgi:hypothetical protein
MSLSGEISQGTRSQCEFTRLGQPVLTEKATYAEHGAPTPGTSKLRRGRVQASLPGHLAPVQLRLVGAGRWACAGRR